MPYIARLLGPQLLKAARAGGRIELYHFRDQQGLEVDFIVPLGPRQLALLEVKASQTPMPAMATSMTRLATSISRYDTQRFVVHAGPVGNPARHALSPKVAAMTLPELLTALT
jgi:hypothetical protein